MTTPILRITQRLHEVANKLVDLEHGYLEDLEDLWGEGDWLHAAARQIADLHVVKIQDGTAANYLQHRLPLEQFTAADLANATGINLRTVQQAIQHMRHAGLIKRCGFRRRPTGKGMHPWLYVRC